MHYEETEFVAATLHIEDLEGLLGKDADLQMPYPPFLQRILGDLDVSMAKFQKRIDNKLYGPKMVERVEALRDRIEAVRPRVNELSAAFTTKRQAAKEAATVAAAESSEQAAAKEAVAKAHESPAGHEPRAKVAKFDAAATAPASARAAANDAVPTSREVWGRFCRVSALVHLLNNAA